MKHRDLAYQGTCAPRDAHQPVGHLAEPVRLVEAKVMIFILRPHEKTRLLPP